MMRKKSSNKMNGNKLARLIAKLNGESKKCKSIEEYVDFAFNFRFEGNTIEPMQIKEEIFTLLKILKNEKPKIVLEIGTANGGTLFLFSKVAAPIATIISIDLPNGPFGGETYPNWKIPLYKSFAKNKQQIHLVREDSHSKKSLDIIKKLLRKRKIDFLLIDGDHRYQGVKKDFETYSKLMKSDGIIAFHDVSYGPKDNVGQVPKFWKEINSKYLLAMG